MPATLTDILVKAIYSYLCNQNKTTLSCCNCNYFHNWLVCLCNPVAKIDQLPFSVSCPLLLSILLYIIFLAGSILFPIIRIFLSPILLGISAGLSAIFIWFQLLPVSLSFSGSLALFFWAIFLVGNLGTGGKRLTTILVPTTFAFLHFTVSLIQGWFKEYIGIIWWKGAA